MAFYFDIADFQLFVKIVEAGSLTRGAEKAFLSVPAASHRLKNIEDNLNLKLLLRSAQGITLTEAGTVYLAHARQVLSQLQLLTSDLQELGAGIKGQLRVLANTTAISEILPAMLGEYLKAHPDVQLELRERLSDDVVRGVRDGIADLGLIAGSVPTEKLQALPLTTCRLILIAPLGHEILRAKGLLFKDILQYEQISLPEGSASHDFLHLHAMNLHIPLKVRVQVSGYEAICRMVESGVGIGLVPSTVYARLNLQGRVGVCELLDDWALRESFLVARDFSTLPKYATEFADTLLESVRQTPGEQSCEP